MASTIAVPGQLLGPAQDYIAGPGTHVHQANLYSSLLGRISKTTSATSSSSLSSGTATTKQQQQQAPPSSGPIKRLTKITGASGNTNTKTTTAPRTMISVSSYSSSSSSPSAAGQSSSNTTTGGKNGGGGGGGSEVLPEVNDVVLCRVTRIQPRQATVAILVVGDAVLGGEWQGLIRAQDVRATEKDRVRVYESFRPGDIVRAQVISLGDQANYYLSTAKNELGVIMATSEAGNTMYPVSWKEYKDPETGLSESRKVAKPF